MRKHMLYFGLAVIAFLLISNEQALSNATKRVFFLQFTDAGCGNCVDGTVIMDSLLADYPDLLIGAKLHGSDSMRIDDGEIYWNYIYTHAIPAAAVDFRDYNYPSNNKVGLDRPYWKRAVDSALKLPAIADIKCVYEINEPGELTLQLSATFNAIPQADLAFNYYVIENEVTGSGKGYDQSNYYNDKAGHQYYGKGNPIVNYAHKNVVRAVGGGLRGIVSSLPPASELELNGTYSFTDKIKLNPNWNKDNLKIVGVLQRQGDDDVMIENSVYAIKGKINSLDDNAEGAQLTVAPNPAGEIVYAHTNLPGDLIVTLTLYDSFGSIAAEYSNCRMGADCGTSINVKSLTPGLYLLVLKSQDISLSTSLIIIR
ncbi:MAG: hypothetical protein ACM3U1_10700 [Chloroflexota bacterium]